MPVRLALACAWPCSLTFAIAQALAASSSVARSNASWPMAASLTFFGMTPSQALLQSLAQSFSGGPAGPLASCSSRSCTRYLNTSVITPGCGLAIGAALGGRRPGECPPTEATAFRLGACGTTALRMVALTSRSHWARARGGGWGRPQSHPHTRRDTLWRRRDAVCAIFVASRVAG